MVYISLAEEVRLVETYGVGYDVIDSYRRYCSRLESKNFNARMGRTAFSDSRRRQLYKAEFKFIHLHGTLGRITLEQAQEIIEDVYYSPEWAQFGNNIRTRIKPTVEVKRIRYAGFAQHNRIVLDVTVGMNVYTLLHELAHTAGHAHHDVSFRRCLVAFVKRFDQAKGRELERIFKENGLQMKLPTEKKPQDFATWLKKYQHMTQVRITRKG